MYVRTKDILSALNVRFPGGAAAQLSGAAPDETCGSGLKISARGPKVTLSLFANVGSIFSKLNF